MFYPSCVVCFEVTYSYLWKVNFRESKLFVFGFQFMTNKFKKGESVTNLLRFLLSGNRGKLFVLMLTKFKVKR